MALTSDTLALLQLIRATGAGAMSSTLIALQERRLASFGRPPAGAKSRVSPDVAASRAIASAFKKHPRRFANELVTQCRFLQWIELTEALIENQRAEFHGFGSFAFRDSYKASVSYTPPPGLLDGEIPWLSDVQSEELEYAIRNVFLALEATGIVERQQRDRFAFSLSDSVLSELAGGIEGARPHAPSKDSFAEMTAIVLAAVLPTISKAMVSRLRADDAETFKTAVAFAVYQASAMAFGTVLRVEQHFAVPLIGSFTVSQGDVSFEADPTFLGMLTSNQPQYA